MFGTAIIGYGHRIVNDEKKVSAKREQNQGLLRRGIFKVVMKPKSHRTPMVFMHVVLYLSNKRMIVMKVTKPVILLVNIMTL